MIKAVYIATGEPESGKSIITLGLMRMLLGKTKKVGYFRPIIDGFPQGKKDNHINTVLTHFDLDMSYDECYAITGQDVIHKKTNGKEGEVIDIIIEKYKALEDRFDFILVEGTDFSGEGLFVELDINVLIAKNIGIPAIIVGSGKGKNVEELVANLHLAYDSFIEKEVKVLALVANKVELDKLSQVKKSISKELKNEVLVSVIPFIENLNNPTIKEIVDELEATIILGEKNIDNQVGGFAVGAMQLRNFLRQLKENSLVITPGDRADIILSSLQASISANYPKVSGIILTGGIIPEEPILKLIKGLKEIVPILSVENGTFEIANKIGAIRSHIYANNKQRIYSSLSTFEKYVDVDALANKLITFEPDGITPKMFQYNLVKRAQKVRKHIVLPESNDERILRAAARLINLDIVDITLLGKKSKIKNAVVKYDIPLNFRKVKIVNPVNSKRYNDYVKTFYELRKHKNINMDMAKDFMADVSYFGTMMVYKGDADGMVSGAVNTTQHTISSTLNFHKTYNKENYKTSVFLLTTYSLLRLYCCNYYSIKNIIYRTSSA